MTDLIGDIHGYADELEALLQKMGYRKKNGAYSHPERKVLFVGDYIDRGPKIRETLEIVKAMSDTGNAVALMGNHEYNALCYHHRSENGTHLREHSFKNKNQYQATLDQFQNDEKGLNDYLNWFMTLPIYYETSKFRAVHACWDNENIDLLRKSLTNDRLTKETLRETVKIGSPLNNAIDQSLKGKEADMPKGQFLIDKDGTRRDKFRIKWWENPAKMTYKKISVLKDDSLPNDEITVDDLKSKNFYSPYEKKVFFGHYWLKGEPMLYRNNICCLDYSVAKEGKLVAYRLDDENHLDERKFVIV